MRYAIIAVVKVALITFFVGPPNFAQSSQTVNSISGFIFDARSNTPVPDVYVELLNDVYSSLKRIKTDGSGRYHFTGLSSGTFKVRVLPYNTNYLEEVQDVTITNYRVGSTVTSDSAYVDFHLRLDKRKINLFEIETTGTVYVQEVPPAARAFYKKAVSQLGNAKESEAGIENLKKAVEIFADYYDALDRLGTEYVKRKQFYEAIPHLVRSVTINQRSFSSFYMLGLAAYNLRQMPEASEAFRAAATINPASIPAQLQYGMVSRINGSYVEAEKALLKAMALAKDSPAGLIHWQLALLYEKLQKYAQAVEHLEKYLKVQPDVQNTEQVKEVIARLKDKSKT